MDRPRRVEVGELVGPPRLGRHLEVVKAVEQGAGLVLGERAGPDSGRPRDPLGGVGRVHPGHPAEQVADRRPVVGVHLVEDHQAVQQGRAGPSFDLVGPRAWSRRGEFNSATPYVTVEAREVGMGSAILWTLIVTLAAEPTGLDEARRLWQNGRYGEAQEGYEALLKEPEKLEPTSASRRSLGLADCLASQGEGAKALDELDRGAAAEPDSADLAARLAELRFEPGRLGRRRSGGGRGARKSTPTTWRPAGWRPGCSRPGASSTTRSKAWKWFIDQYNAQAAGHQARRRRAVDRRPGLRALRSRGGSGRRARATRSTT